MSFADLQRIVTQLATDPRTHPNTPIEFDLVTALPDGDTTTTAHVPVAAHIETVNRRIVFTDRATRNDVAR